MSNGSFETESPLIKLESIGILFPLGKDIGVLRSDRFSTLRVWAERDKNAMDWY